MTDVDESVRKRFEAKAAVKDGCWEWQACKDGSGYGRLLVDGRARKAHRVAYQLYCGEVPSGLCVLHRCDNPACVNPKHLFLGTHLENMQDMIVKGRKRCLYGEKHHGAKLTAAAVIAIRQDPRRGEDVAKDYGVSRSLVGQIRRKEGWRQVEGWSLS